MIHEQDYRLWIVVDSCSANVIHGKDIHHQCLFMVYKQDYGLYIITLYIAGMCIAIAAPVLPPSSLLKFD